MKLSDSIRHVEEISIALCYHSSPSCWSSQLCWGRPPATESRVPSSPRHKRNVKESVHTHLPPTKHLYSTTTPLFQWEEKVRAIVVEQWMSSTTTALNSIAAFRSHFLNYRYTIREAECFPCCFWWKHSHRLFEESWNQLRPIKKRREKREEERKKTI